MRRASHIRQDPNFLPERQQQRRSPPTPSWVGEGLPGLQEFGSPLSGQNLDSSLTETTAVCHSYLLHTLQLKR